MMKISKDILSRIKQDIIDQISQTKTEDQLENIRISFLGRQGTIASLMKELKTLSLEEKKEFGPLLNILKQEGEKLYQNKILYSDYDYWYSASVNLLEKTAFLAKFF